MSKTFATQNANLPFVDFYTIYLMHDQRAPHALSVVLAVISLQIFGIPRWSIMECLDKNRGFIFLSSEDEEDLKLLGLK